MCPRLAVVVPIAILGLGACTDRMSGPTRPESGAFQSVGLVVPPQTIILQPDADTYIRKGAPNQNQGADLILRLQSSGHNRALLRLSSTALAEAVGAGSVISAHLQLSISRNGENWGSTGRPVDLHRLSVRWSELHATWNCAIDSNPDNASPDCTGSQLWDMGDDESPPWNPTPSASTVISREQLGTVALDVTADVVGWVSGSLEDLGWILKKRDEGQAGLVEFDSRESDEPPQLIMVVQPPPPGNTLSLSPFGSGEGRVTSVPAGIDCMYAAGAGSGTCSAVFPSATAVTLTAASASGSSFAGYRGDLNSNENTAIVSLDGDAAVSVEFARTIRLQITVRCAAVGFCGVAQASWSPFNTGEIFGRGANCFGEATCEYFYRVPSSTVMTLEAGGRVYVNIPYEIKWSGCDATDGDSRGSPARCHLTSFTRDFDLVADYTGPAPWVNGLVAHYPLDGGGADIAGGKVHATLSSPAWTHDRHTTPVSALQVSTSATNGVVTGLSTMHPLGFGKFDQFSVAAWVKADSVTTGLEPEGIVGVGATSLRVGMRVAPDGIPYAGGCFSGNPCWDTRMIAGTTTPTSLIPGRWYHLAMVYDGATRAMHFYQDGGLVGQASIPSVFGNRFTDGFFWFGGFPGSATEWFRGAVDDVRVYRRLLTHVEISELATP